MYTGASRHYIERRGGGGGGCVGTRSGVVMILGDNYLIQNMMCGMMSGMVSDT